MANSFNRNFSVNNQEKEQDVLKIGTDGGIPIKINKDGIVEARGFVDASDNLNLFNSNGRIFSKTAITDSTSSVLDVSSGKRIFNSVKSYYLKLTNAFRTYSFPLQSYSHVQYFKFNFLNKKIKKIAAGIVASGNRFIFHFVKNSKRYSDKTATNFATKIYTVPVTLKFSDSFRNLHN